MNAPTNLAANATSSSSITLTWTDNSPDEIGFTFMYDTNSSFSSPTYVWTGGANVTSYVHSGRSAATTYYYRVKAEGATDPQDSAFSNTAAATTAPANTAASAVSDSQINVSWSGNAANGSINGYTVATNTVASHSGASYQFVSGASAASLAKTGLNANTTYYFAVKAEGTTDAYDSSFSGWANATTQPAGPTPAISPHFWGVNAWMPHQIGAHVYYGSLANHWTNIGNSGAKIMRYGGNGVDHHADPSWVDPNDANKSTLKQYHAMVNSMQSLGIEPVLQVPVYGGAYDATDAANIVYYINVTHGENVKYWSIGNEPDLPGGVYNGGNVTASYVANYFKPIASAMKAVDPTIKIIGPDTAWYNETIINGLTDCTTPNSSTNITGVDANGRHYVDILAFHHYNGFSGSQSRSDVINSIMSSGGLNDKLALLQNRLNLCNPYRSSNPLKMAITELNVNYNNSSSDSLTGTGAESFVGGQWWAEAMGVSLRHGVDFVTFWSAIEGSTVNGNELGFIGADGVKKPSYWHFNMMATNFRGNSVSTADNHASVKTFASKASDQVAVLIMNQDQASNLGYTVRLNTATPATGTVKISVDAGLAVESTGTIAAESTILLVFDASGILKKKIEYKLYGHANSNLAPTVTLY